MDIAFQSMKQSPILRNKSEGSGSVFVWDPRMMPAAYVKPMAEVLQKSRSLAQSAWHSSNLCVSGTRGVACIFTDNGRFQLFDMVGNATWFNQYISGFPANFQRVGGGRR